ncbi:MAG: hypothetical protein PUK77_00820 [bacterium]|nr:hypothetical protein [bacterium]MDD7750230.1 hypothetical protein [bacterium]
MSMLPMFIKPLLKTEIDRRVNQYIALFAGELDHRPLLLKLDVAIEDIRIDIATSSPFGGKEEQVRTEHLNSYTWTETTGDGNHRSFLNNPDRVALEDLNLSGTARINGIHFEKQVMGMGVKLKDVSFRFRITGSLMY